MMSAIMNIRGCFGLTCCLHFQGDLNLVHFDVEVIGRKKIIFSYAFPVSSRWKIESVNFSYKYKPYIVKHNSISDFIKMYFLHCFFQRHVSALVMSHLQVDYFS